MHGPSPKPLVSALLVFRSASSGKKQAVKQTGCAAQEQRGQLTPTAQKQIKTRQKTATLPPTHIAVRVVQGRLIYEVSHPIALGPRSSGARSCTGRRKADVTYFLRIPAGASTLT